MSEKIIAIRALSRKVLTVAITGTVGDWAAYIDAVPGKSHENEKQEVTQTGEKLPYEIAKLLFPQIASEYKWRR